MRPGGWDFLCKEKIYDDEPFNEAHLRTTRLLWDAPGPVLEQRRLVEEPPGTRVHEFVVLSAPATVGRSRDRREISACVSCCA